MSKPYFIAGFWTRGKAFQRRPGISSRQSHRDRTLATLSCESGELKHWEGPRC